MSKIQICNRGLSTYLGASRITSFTQDSPEAEQCDLHYPDVVQAIQERHWWDFNKARQTLAELTNDRPTEWAYKYAKPATAIMIRWVNHPDVAIASILQNKSPDSEREMTSDAIYSNVQYAVCEFSVLVTDTTLFPQYVKDAISAELAASIAMPLTEDIKRANNAMTVAQDRLDVAMALDESNTPPIQGMQMPDWLTDRGIT